jgi:hypothetical protein
MTYEVTDEKEEDLVLFLCRFLFLGKTKWCLDDLFKSQYVKDGVNERHISQHMQLTPPQKTNHLY